MRVAFGDVDGIVFGDFVTCEIDADRAQIFFKSDSEVIYSAGHVVGIHAFHFVEAVSKFLNGAVGKKKWCGSG